MNIIKPYYVIETNINGERIVSNLERYGRVCYKSEGKITLESAAKFLKSAIERGHESILEHESITVRFICDRGMTHELVRHRLCAYSQESTRYCNYSKIGMTFIEPLWGFDYDDLQYLKSVEDYYNRKIAEGQTPQQARGFLPICVKTEIVHTANIREWRHIFKLRTTPKAHPAIRDMMIRLLLDFRNQIPVLFDDIEVENE